MIKNNFVADISHEIKTPLSIIKSDVEGINVVIQKENQEFYFDVIIDKINRLDILLNELLDLSKSVTDNITFTLIFRY